MTAMHSDCVTSCLPSQNLRPIRIRAGSKPKDFGGTAEPIRNSRAGTHATCIPSNTRDSPTRGCAVALLTKATALNQTINETRVMS